jgi:hypothetical protein
MPMVDVMAAEIVTAMALDSKEGKRAETVTNTSRHCLQLAAGSYHDILR